MTGALGQGKYCAVARANGPRQLSHKARWDSDLCRCVRFNGTYILAVDIPNNFGEEKGPFRRYEIGKRNRICS